MLGTVGFGAPVFGVFAEDNKPRFRDGKPWPESIVDGVRLGEEAGYMPVNARTVWDAGVILGYCTDTTYDPKAGLDHELKMLNLMFSMQDIIKMMGPNTASYIQMGDQLGTLEPGKLADIILLDGNPLEGYWNRLKTKVVVRAAGRSSINASRDTTTDSLSGGAVALSWGFVARSHAGSAHPSRISVRFEQLGMPRAISELNTFGDDDLGATTDTSIYTKLRIDLSVDRHCWARSLLQTSVR